VPPALLALSCASHDGTAQHVEGVRQLLALSGLTESALQNTPDLPLDATTARDVVRRGGVATSLQQNCSGKHAAMLLTCVSNGWGVEQYLLPEHPLQQHITATIDQALGDDRHRHIGVDGCGAPAHALTLIGLARMFRTVAGGARNDSAAAQVHAAMTGYPQMVAGQRRDVTLAMQQVPGLMVKDGAEGVVAAAAPDGRAFALKIADGGDRARSAVLFAGLAALGFDVGDLPSRCAPQVLGHGRAVGVVRPLAP
jgi:L-asparaginase II